MMPEGLYNAEPMTCSFHQTSCKGKHPQQTGLSKKESVLAHITEKFRVGLTSSMAGSRGLKL